MIIFSNITKAYNDHAKLITEARNKAYAIYREQNRSEIGASESYSGGGRKFVGKSSQEEFFDTISNIFKQLGKIFAEIMKHWKMILISGVALFIIKYR